MNEIGIWTARTYSLIKTGQSNMQNKQSSWLIHRYETDNVGDLLIGRAHKAILLDRGYDVQQFEYTGTKIGEKISFPTRVLWRISPNLVYFFKVLKNLRKAFLHRPDLITVGGGQLLLLRRTFIPSLLGWYIISILVGSKFVLFSVGTEETSNKKRKLYQRILNHVVNKADHVIVRDFETRTLLVNAGGQRKILTSPDCVYYLARKSEADNQEQKTGVLISLAHTDIVKEYAKFESLSHYFDYVSDLVMKTVSEGERVSIISTTIHDYNEQDLVKYELEKRLKISIWTQDKFEDLDGFLERVSCYRAMISSRMHALIIAEIKGLSLRPVPVSNKLRSYKNTLMNRDAMFAHEEVCSLADYVYGLGKQ